ncbi:MAG: hypothetical protein ACP5U1_15625 [Desulfomonilaceae bacterium]
MLLKAFHTFRSIKYKQLSLLPKLAIIFIIAITILTGCASRLFKAEKTDDQKSKSAKTGSALIKPRLTSKADNDSSQQSKKTETKQPQSTEKNKTPDKSTSGSNVPDIQSAGRAGPLRSADSKDLNSEDRASKRLVGPERGKIPPESEQIQGDKPGEVKIKESDDNEWMKPEGKQPSFKKHDHTKYVNRIKNLAMNILKRQEKSFYATMCCDSTTEEWSLTIYFKSQNSFRYRSFVWDPIDDKWEQMYESGNKPLSGWKKHLSYSTADKKCTQLGGSDKK